MVMPTPVHPKLSDPMISKLAREVARDLKPMADTLKAFGLDANEFDSLADTKFFQVRLQEELALWNASDPMTIGKRIGIKAATMIEDCLLEVYALIHDPNQPMSAKIEGLKWASRMAGLGENSNVKSGGEPDSQVKITINIGQHKVELDEALAPRTIEGEVVTLTPASNP